MVTLFLGGSGLFLFFSGVLSLLCDPPDTKRRMLYFMVFAGLVLLGGAAYVSYEEKAYRIKRLDAWSSIKAVEEMPPVEIEGKWYKIVLEEIESPKGN